MNWRVTATSVIVWRASRFRMCSMQGRLTIRIIGLGWSLVSGRNRVPCPPAIMIAFIQPHPRLEYSPQAHNIHEPRHDGEPEAHVENNLPHAARADHHERDRSHEHGRRGLAYPVDPDLTPHHKAPHERQEVSPDQNDD